MKKICFIVFTLFIIISNAGFGQANEIKVRFIGNCGLHLTDGKSDLYVDFPYKSGAYKYMQYDRSEIDNIKDSAVFLFTHRHADHYSKKLLNEIKAKHKGRVFGNWNVKKIQQLNVFFDDFKIEPLKTSHSFTFIHYSYVITWHGKRIYFSGDTGSLDEVSKLQNLDWAFISPWLFMNAQDAKIKIDTKMFGIYHLYPTQKLQEVVPPNILFLKNQGEIITIPY